MLIILVKCRNVHVNQLEKGDRGCGPRGRGDHGRQGPCGSAVARQEGGGQGGVEDFEAIMLVKYRTTEFLTK